MVAGFRLLNSNPDESRDWAAATLGLQIAQSRSYLYSLGPKVSILYALGNPGLRNLKTTMTIWICGKSNGI